MNSMISGFSFIWPANLLQTSLFLFFLCPLFSFSADKHDLVPAPDKNGNWGYVEARSKKVVIAPRYDKAAFFRDGVALVSVAGLYGLIDRTGKEIVPIVYEGIRRARLPYGKGEIVPGFFEVMKERLYGVAGSDGALLLPLGKYRNIHFYKEGYFSFDGSFWIDGKVYDPPSGYVISRNIEEADAFMIEPSSESTSGTSKKDLMLQSSMGKKGVMRRSKEILIQPQYDKIDFVHVPEKRWVVSQGDRKMLGKLLKALVTGGSVEMDEEKDWVTFWLLDENGKEIRQFQARYYPFVKNGRVTYESGGKEYEINPLDGTLMTREASIKAGKDYVIFQERGFWGVRDNAGQVRIEPQYVSMSSLGGDLFAVRKIEGADTRRQAPEYDVYAENIGVVNAANQVVMPFEYRAIESLRYPDIRTASFLVGKTVPDKNDPDSEVRYGIADRSGGIIVPLQYESHFYMNKAGQAIIRQDGKEGVIDHTGRLILAPAYHSIFDTARLDKTENVFYMAEKDRLWGVYDADGNEIVPHQYGYIFINKANIEKGWVIGDSPDRDKKGAYNYRTKVEIPAVYASIRIYDHLVGVYRPSGNSSSRSEYDLLDFKGNRLATYEQLEALSGGGFIVQKDGLFGLLDSNGRMIVSPTYQSLREAEAGFLWAKDDKEHDFFISEKGEVYRIDG